MLVMAGTEVLEGPQQAKSRRTRTALLNAAVDCLVERGYAATTVVEVAKKAGVSRGAQQHHFPAKADLLTAAVGHLIEQRISDYRKAFANLEPGTATLEASIDLLWSTYSGPCFIAWAELWMAARTDPELRKVVLTMDARMREQSHAIYAEMYPDADPDDLRFQEFGHDFAFAYLDGVALNASLSGANRRTPEEMVLMLKFVASTLEGVR
jgi:AcrR family transcriptional regulator